MQLPDMNLLIALDTLLDEGSVVGAAQRMNLSAAAMSRTLTRIRHAVGDPILVRAGRGLVPTPRALALRARVRSLVEQATVVFTSHNEVDLSTLKRCFNLRANGVFSAAFGGQLLESMRTHAPHTVLCFVPEGGGEDDALREGLIDLYISATRDFSPEVKLQSLFSTQFVGLARTGHPLFDQEITPQRFASYDHVSVSRRGRACGPIDTALAGMGLTRRVGLITPSFHSAIFLLPESDLILSLPEHVQQKVAHLGLPLRSFALPLSLSSVNVMQAWHPRFDNDPAHRWLRQTLKQICSQQSPGHVGAP